MKSLIICMFFALVVGGQAAYRERRQLDGYRYQRNEPKDVSDYRTRSRPQYEEILADRYQPVSTGSSVKPQSPQAYRANSDDDPYASGYRSSALAYQPSAPYSPSSSYGSQPSSPSRHSSSYGSNVSPKKAEEDYGNKEESEEDKKPSKLELLLAQSKFTCSSKKDGYYADGSVNCQVFHYCVGGAKHSWMCPEDTVFHQVHLNCVPSSQDICSQSEKFYVVNDYLHKPLDNQGPNNTIRYHQRYYPQEFLGDPIAAAFPTQPARQSYPSAAAAPARPAARPVSNYATSNSYVPSNNYDDASSYDRDPDSRSNSYSPSSYGSSSYGSPASSYGSSPSSYGSSGSTYGSSSSYPSATLTRSKPTPVLTNLPSYQPQNDYSYQPKPTVSSYKPQQPVTTPAPVSRPYTNYETDTRRPSYVASSYDPSSYQRSPSSASYQPSVTTARPVSSQRYRSEPTASVNPYSSPNQYASYKPSTVPSVSYYPRSSSSSLPSSYSSSKPTGSSYSLPYSSYTSGYQPTSGTSGSGAYGPPSAPRSSAYDTYRPSSSSSSGSSKPYDSYSGVTYEEDY